MENYEVTEREVTDVTVEPEYETETNTEEKGVSLKDAAVIGAVTLAGAALIKAVVKKAKPSFVKWCVKVAKKNGYTCVSNEVLDSEEETIEETYEVEEE